MTRHCETIGRRPALWRGLAVGLCLAGALAATPATAEEAETPTPAPEDGPVVSPGVTVVAADPWQPVNRPLFALGMGIDHAVIGPITHAYMRVTPQPVRNRVSSVVYNLNEPSTVLEDILQGHPKRAGQATARFVVNSTVGLLGMFDVASRWGIASHESDFGQTLGRYGVRPGPYLFVPILGPLNARDGVGRVVDIVTDPVGFVTGPITSAAGATRYGGTALDQRALSDPAFEALNDATDPYVTTRSAYTQYRAARVEAATGVTQALPDFDEPPSAQ